MSLSDCSSKDIDLLLSDEAEQPEMLFTRFFESFDIEETTLQLREAMKIVIREKFANQEYSIEEDNVRFFFEKLEKVLEAAWLLR